jgi:predicted O-methyltransferase YrrM
MASEQWAAVDRYIGDLLVPQDTALTNALAASAAAGLPPINVAPNQGKLLQLYAQMIGAKTILEIGTLGGYSTIWLARALPPGGHVLSLEADPKHAEIARANIAAAGLATSVEVRLGKAMDSLAQIEAEKRPAFDFIFIDADKANLPNYFASALKLSHRGSIILVDNVVREGRVIDAKNEDPNIKGVRRMNEMIAAEPRVSATALQTVGSKGYDGFALIRVIADA